MSENPVVQMRCDLLNGNFEHDKETVEFMRFAREEVARCARAVCAARPKNADVGRVIAFVDKLQDAKDTICAAAIIGDETAKRAEKKRKAEVLVEPVETLPSLIRQFAAAVEPRLESTSGALVGPEELALAQKMAAHGRLTPADFAAMSER